MNSMLIKFSLFAISHVCLILFGGYFLSPEFAVYPYLQDQGFLPYQNIVDQHLPIIAFGPIHLPAILATSYWLLLTFLTLVVLTDLFLFLLLIKHESKHTTLVMFFYVSCSLFFGGNTFWYETWISFFLSGAMLLADSENMFKQLSAGVLVGLTLLCKPIILLGVVFLFIYRRLTVTRFHIAGILVPVAITILFLARFDLINAAHQMIFVFNTGPYIKIASQSPSLRQIFFTLAFIALPVFSALFRRNLTLGLSTMGLLSLLAYPRFEPFHLQVAVLGVVLLMTPLSMSKHTIYLLNGLSVILMVMVFVRIFNHPYGNFYFTKDLDSVSDWVKSFDSDNTLYILGGEDLIYPLAQKIPPGYTYIPSLPWYLQSSQLQKAIISSLAVSPNTPILIRKTSTIDKVNIYQSSGSIREYIEKNYKLHEERFGYGLYLNKLLYP